MVNNKKRCFVIMPFSRTDSCTEEKWTEIYDHIIKPAVEECGLGYECIRYRLGRSSVVKDILEDLHRALLVVADLTDNNANVMWELGVRHTLKRRTILIGQNKNFLPSDLKDYPLIVYNLTKTGFDKFKAEIKEKLEDIEKNPDKPDSPVAEFLGIKNIDILSYEKSANLKKLSALVFEMSCNLEMIGPILTTCQENQKARKKKKPISIKTGHFQNSCLELLLSDRYILLPDNLIRLLTPFNGFIMETNNQLDLWSQEACGHSVEKTLIDSSLPDMKEGLERFLKNINKVRIDYMNNNYQEPEIPAILLASPEHEKYLKLTE